MKKILEILKQSTDNQDKYLDVLFLKAVHEKAFVSLYAKLCKDLDNDLPQKAQTNPSKGKEKEEKSGEKEKGKKETSYMRSKLLEKCREIFKMNKNLEENIKGENQEERDNKLKKFFLGNINFIGELINISVLSKKIVDQCIETLLKKYQNETEGGVKKYIALEGAVILLDKFGTIINHNKSSLLALILLKTKFLSVSIHI